MLSSPRGRPPEELYENIQGDFSNPSFLKDFHSFFTLLRFYLTWATFSSSFSQAARLSLLQIGQDWLRVGLHLLDSELVGLEAIIDSNHKMLGGSSWGWC